MENASSVIFRERKAGSHGVRSKKTKRKGFVLTAESLEDRRMLAPAGCFRSTCGGYGPSSDGTNVTSFTSPLGNWNYNSNSADPIQNAQEDTGMNGPIVAHQVDGVGSLLEEISGLQFLRFRQARLDLASRYPSSRLAMPITRPMTSLRHPMILTLRGPASTLRPSFPMINWEPRHSNSTLPSNTRTRPGHG